MKEKIKAALSAPWACVVNLLLVYVCFALCRIIFVWVNYSSFPDLTFSRIWEMGCGGLLFDTSAIVYTNILYILLMLFPLHFKERWGFHTGAKWLFVATNMLCVVMNLMDTVYFQYTGRRTTASVFGQFSHEDNLAGIIGLELLNHWYLVLAAVAIGYGLYKLYRRPQVPVRSGLGTYYAARVLVLVACIPLCVFGMRGGVTGAVRPITISNANQYVDRPIETAIVLNTPFSIYRTFGKKVFVTPHYFPDEASLAQVYTPVHQPVEGATPNRKNVVVFVLESFGKEYIGSLNKDLDGGTYQGYTPFLDSLITQSLVFEHSFANGRASIDGLPSVLSGIPRFVEPFFLTPASLNKLSSIGGELKKNGYYTAFFHGAQDGSMGFQAYARTAGYTDYFGREEYNNDADFDGSWAIWDEEFLQFFADKMSTFQQPFATGIFTASSHHPFRIPERYTEQFPEGPMPITKCVRYSDHALRRFFEKASKQPWFENTLFVLTADHTNQSNYPEYKADCGFFAVPVIFYTPNGDLKGHREGISQQIDIMPTVLSYLGYDKPYVTFGCDLLTTPLEETFAVNQLNDTYQYLQGNYMLQFDGQKATAVYDYVNDRLLKNNLLGQVPEQAVMEQKLKAIIQQYMARMNEDRMVVSNN